MEVTMRVKIFGTDHLLNIIYFYWFHHWTHAIKLKAINCDTVLIKCKVFKSPRAYDLKLQQKTLSPMTSH